VTFTSLVPAEVDDVADDDAVQGAVAPNEYEPDEASVLADLLPRALTTKIYAALLESSASELAARMTAMDNATRNAGDLIDRLTMEYNRSRQAAITTELIEIISGAEAL
jgi:F-type H+-transporting ATPase subunit gamma